jgi:hypothetical protein
MMTKADIIAAALVLALFILIVEGMYFLTGGRLEPGFRRPYTNGVLSATQRDFQLSPRTQDAGV